MRTEVEILVPRAAEGLFNRKRRSPAENQLSFMNVGHLALEEELFPSLTSDVTVKQSDKDRRKWPQQTRPMVRFSQQLKNIERRKIDTVTNQEGFVGGIRMCRAANKKINKVVDSD